MSCTDGPAKANICVIRGQDYRKTWTFTLSDGTARDFTGYTVTAFLRDDPGDAALLSLSSTETANGSVLTVTDNEIEVYIAAADITAVSGAADTTAELIWSLWLEDSTGDDQPEITGAFIVSPVV